MNKASHPKLYLALEEICIKLLSAVPPDNDGDVYQTVIDYVDRCLIRCALEQCNGNQVAAARRLGLHRNTLRRKLRATVLK